MHTRRLATAMVAADVDVHVAAFAQPTGVTGARFHRLRPSSPRGGKYLLAVPELKALIRHIQPDFVHAHYISSYGLMAALASPSRLVQTAWGTDLLITAQRRLRGRVASFSLSRASLATGDSRSLLDEIKRLAPRTVRHRFVFGPPRSHFGAHKKDEIVLSPRNHDANYQIDLVLKAWRIARGALPGCRLVVAGTGPMTATLRKQAPDDVEFVGMLDHGGMLDLVARSRAVVSVPRSDATSAAVLEALAARCSVVATDLPANREWIPATHLVSVTAAPDELGKAIVRCIDQPLELSQEWSIEAQVDLLLETVYGLGKGT